MPALAPGVDRFMLGAGSFAAWQAVLRARDRSLLRTLPPALRAQPCAALRVCPGSSTEDCSSKNVH
jgi:hypothetical protein